MAADERLLGEAEGGVASFRVYGWSGVWVSLGRGQSPEATLCCPESTHWVRRPTGGSAVLHGHDVTVAIALPLPRSAHAYRVVTEPLVAALNRCGVPARLSEDAARGIYRQFPDCFATTSANDIIDPATGQKICGCALRRTRAAVLLQASIPAQEPGVVPEEIIVGGVRTALTEVDPECLAEALRTLMQ